jgi:hypothetical protein
MRADQSKTYSGRWQMPEETTAQTQEKYTPHPRGQRTKGSCFYLECTEEASASRRVAYSSFTRLMVDVCDDHAKALDGGATILIEFTKG